MFERLFPGQCELRPVVGTTAPGFRAGSSYSFDRLVTHPKMFLNVHQIQLPMASSSDVAVTQRKAPRTCASGLVSVIPVRERYQGRLTPAPAMSGSPSNSPGLMLPRERTVERSAE